VQHSKLDSAEKNGVVILDGDDTLWRTQQLYDSAKREFVELIGRESSSVRDVIPRLEVIDSHRVSQSEFAPSRFVGSMMILYSQVCREENLIRRKTVESRIKMLGSLVSRTPRLYADTIPTLGRLSKSYELVLATKGKTRLQRDKVRRLRLKRCFTKLYFLKKKTSREYRMILSDLAVPYNRVWVVGNSIRSDINPALQIGLRSIWIPRKTWVYEEASPRAGPMFTAKSLRQASRIILSQDKG
jgi:putative hydrolase of the HAD superfamily